MTQIRGFTGNSVDATGVGPCVALLLADRDATARWRFYVDAVYPLGPVRVGTLESTAPTLGSGKTRLLGVAFLPGVAGWRVTWERIAGPTDAIGDLQLLASADYCGPIGIVPNGPFSTVVP